VSEADVDRVDRATLSARGWRSTADRPYRTAFNVVEHVERGRARAAATGTPPDSLPLDLDSAAELFEELDWPAGARSAYAEAAGYYRHLVRNSPGRYEAMLGRSLGSLCRVLLALDRYDEALPVAIESRDAYRRAVDTVDYAAGSANMAQQRVGEILVRLGRHEEAVAAAAERVDEVRAWPTRGKPARLRSYHLIYALEEYADRLERVGRLAEALTATREATRRWRRKAASEPVKYAAAVDRLGKRLAAVGRHAEAAVRYGQVVDLARGLDPSNWYHRHALAAALTNHSIRLRSLGRRREAVPAAAEAVERFRELVEARRARAAADDAARTADPDWDEHWSARPARERALREDEADIRAVELTLTVALTNHAVDLHGVRRRDDAHAVLAEAVATARRLSTMDGHRAWPALARALNNLAILLGALDRPEPAVSAAAESVDRWTTLAAADPARHASGLARARNTLGAALLAVGRLDEALTASARALTQWREMAADQPARYDGELADALVDHGRVRSARGEHAEAADATAEAEARYGRLAAADPGRYAGEHARALRVFAEVRLAAGADRPAARAAAGAALAAFERLAAEQPEAYGADVVSARALRDRLR
jgi:tetratricopeptide (TPR) repeat protein